MNRIIFASIVIASAGSFPIQSAELNTSQIEALTGLKGTLNSGEHTFKVSFPRKDIQMTVAGTRMVPELGLTAWAAFTEAGDQTIAMGDIVLLESEVNPIMSVALENGLEVTALHNHFLWDTPRVMFMHIGGKSDAATMARAVGQVFTKLKEVIQTKPGVPSADIDPLKTSFDPEIIDAVLGTTGTLANGVYKVVVGRVAKIEGHVIGKEMGVNTWAAFAGNDQRAIVDGDFVMLETEVQGVLKLLRNAGINIVAIHNHMAGETPRYVFLHYWGTGPVQELAKGLKAALDTQVY